MRQNPDEVHNFLNDRIAVWTEAERKGARAQARIVLQDTQDLAREFDQITGDGLKRRIDYRAAQPLSHRLALAAVRPQIKKAVDLFKKQQYEPALAILTQAEKENQAPTDPYLQAVLHHRRGQIFQALRRYRDAQAQYEAAERRHAELGDKKALAAVQLDFALLYKQRGRLPEAIQRYERAYRDQLRILSLADAAQTLINLGNLYTQVGDLRQGLEKLHEALPLTEQVSDPSHRAMALNNLGHAYSVQRQYGMAESFFGRALTAAKAAERDRDRLTGMILHNLGELSFRTDKLEQAVQYLRRAYEIKTKTAHPSPDSIALTLRAFGEVYLSTRRWREAETYIARALQEAGRSSHGIFDAVLLSTLYDLQGNLFAQQDRLKEAATALERAVQGIETELDDLKSHQWKTGLLSLSQDCFHDLILLNQERLHRPVAAFDVAEKARARAFLDLVGGQVGFDYGDQLADGARGIKDVLSTVNAQPLPWEALQPRLPPEVSIVAYTVTEKQLLIWVLDKTGLQSKAVPIAREALDKLVYDFREAVTLSGAHFIKRFPSWKAGLQETQRRGRALYQQLVTPIKDLIPPHRLICFVPDSSLYYVPFAALVNPETGAFLVEERTIFYAPSASILAWSLEIQSRKPPANRLLVVSNPALGKEVLRQFRYLTPLTEAEAFDRQIARQFRDSGFLGGVAATKSAVWAAMPDYEIVHLSAHSILNSRDPLYSTLVLAAEPQPSEWIPVKQTEGVESGDSGLLYTHELFQRPLPKVRLLVLSACETALGRLWNGEGMVGMARAVFYARVPSLLATQWKVADRPTGQLMLEFYKQMDTQATIADALAQAQRAYLRQSGLAEHRHPYAWGGFCLMGSYRLRG